jgi:hypothetical protein
MSSHARRGGVDGFRQRPGADASRSQRAYRFDQVRHGTPKPIQPPDGQHFAVAQVGQRISKAGAVGFGPGSRVLENALAVCLAQRIRLQSGVLFRRRYPRIADQCQWTKPLAR